MDGHLSCSMQLVISGQARFVVLPSSTFGLSKWHDATRRSLTTKLVEPSHFATDLAVKCQNLVGSCSTHNSSFTALVHSVCVSPSSGREVLST